MFNDMMMFDRWSQAMATKDPEMYYQEQEKARPWISSSTDTLDKEDFIGFEQIPISMSSVLNSPPESVKSNHIYEEDSNTMFNTSELMDTEQSFTIVMDEQSEYSPHYFYSDFHEEIDQIANEHTYSMPNKQMNIVKYENDNVTDDDDDNDDDDALIFGNADVMISSPPPANVVNSQEEILNETLNNSNNNNNNNIVNMNIAQSTLLMKRNQCLPQLKLTATVKMMPIENCKASSIPVAEAAAAAAAPATPASGTEQKNPINDTNAVLSTPQMEEDILDLENDFPNFDLVSYIDNDTNNTTQTTTNMIDANSIKKEVEHDVSISNIEQILPTPIASPSMQSMQNDDEIMDEPMSPVPTPVNERAKRVLKRRTPIKYESDDDYQPAKRPRGRPPKTEPTQLTPAELKRLSPSDRKYAEMRLKNNEASRRSRLNRKGKEEALFDQLESLQTINDELKALDSSLDRQLKSWENKFLKLARL